jgi:oligopeptide transport system substrate-binding protein
MSFLVFLIVVISSCSPKSEKADQLIFGLESEPERLHPITIKDPQTFYIAWQIYEGLLGLGESGKIVPKIAESWETKDNKVWIFHIRRNISYHPSDMFNTPDKTRGVNSHDVFYSFTRFCSKEAYPAFVLTDTIKGCAEYNQGKVESVDGLKVIDEYTFQIELIKPEPFFINRLTSPWIAIFPKEAEQKKFKERWGLDIAVGTGPYRLLSKTDNEIILVKNATYWDKNRMPRMEKIIFRIIKNDQIRFSELTKSNIDMMVLPNQLFPVIFDKSGTMKNKYENKFRVKKISTFNSHFIGINLKRIQDVHLRKSMSYGTNRKEIVQKILYGYGDITGGIVPPGINGYVPLVGNPYNLQKAKEELAKSQYDGKEMVLLVHDLANSEQISQIFQKQMADIGVKIKLVKSDFNSAIGKMIKGETDLFCMFAEFVYSSPEPILIASFATEKIPVPNVFGYSNHEIDRKLQGLRDINDRQMSVKVSAEIEKDIAHVPLS